jgi:hypothetical protein
MSPKAFTDMINDDYVEFIADRAQCLRERTFNRKIRPLPRE